jgi:hypothetical protein
MRRRDSGWGDGRKNEQKQRKNAKVAKVYAKVAEAGERRIKTE